MENVREKRQALEKLIVGERGVRAADSRGRERPEEESDVRTCFQRDVDRISHSKAFRRLKHKTQVFLAPEGDHYRTRLTHTLEVTRVARTIARGLMLNEDLTEAIGLGHDLGHTPFGHAGERALDAIYKPEGGFRHYEQSLRVVDLLEKDGEGLNLTWEVRNGILRHTCDPLAATLEGQTVRLADKIAYINSDVDDAVRAGALREEELPERVRETLGRSYSERIDTIVKDVIACGTEGDVAMSGDIAVALDAFYDFMNERVYHNPRVKSEESKVAGILGGIYDHLAGNLDELPAEYMTIAEKNGRPRAILDYISGMTDDFALWYFNDIYVPKAWNMR